MELFSGRFDILTSMTGLTENEVLREVIQPGSIQYQYTEYFKQFLKYAGSDYFLLSHEKFEKDGVTPTKAHCHFLFNSKKKHDTLRGKLSDMGWKGPLASLSVAVAPPKRTLEGAHNYVLKQGDVWLSSLSSDDLDKKKEVAKNYNDELVLKPQFDHHFRQFIMPEMKKQNIMFRGDMLIYIIEYVTKYNQNERGIEMKLPTTTSVMLGYLQLYEMKHLPKTSLYSILKDYRNIDGYNETAKDIVHRELYEQEQDKKALAVAMSHPHAFEDSDDEKVI